MLEKPKLLSQSERGVILLAYPIYGSEAINHEGFFFLV